MGARVTPTPHPPQAITDVSSYAVDAILGGSFGWLHIPRGGYLEVRWLTRKECYRLTIDVTAGHELVPEKAAEFNAETLRRLEELVAR